MQINKLWQDRFQPLAVYNGEVSRGVVHTAEYCAAMATLQAEYDARLQAMVESQAQVRPKRAVQQLKHKY